MMSLQERFKAALKKRDETQLALATAAGVKAPSVNGWVSGQSTALKAETALKAAKFLRVRPWWLVFGEGPMEEDGQSAPFDQRSHVSLEDDAAHTGRPYVSHVLAQLAAALAEKSPEQREAIKPSVLRVVDNPADPAPAVKITRLVMEEPEVGLHPQAAQADANASFDIWTLAKRMAINWPDAAERSAIARFILEVEQLERDKSPLAARPQGTRGTAVR